MTTRTTATKWIVVHIILESQSVLNTSLWFLLLIISKVSWCVSNCRVLYCNGKIQFWDEKQKSRVQRQAALVRIYTLLFSHSKDSCSRNTVMIGHMMCILYILQNPPSNHFIPHVWKHAPKLIRTVILTAKISFIFLIKLNICLDFFWSKFYTAIH
jgi:hypothetical protein